MARSTSSGGYPDRMHVLAVVDETLVERCMTAHGQVYWPNEAPLVAGSDDDRVVDMTKRRREGYGLTTNAPPPAGPNENQPAYQLALFGSDQRRLALRLPDGCRTEVACTSWWSCIPCPPIPTTSVTTT